ncbi:MAG: peptidase S8 [Vulcanimicrobiaceae bacterium]
MHMTSKLIAVAAFASLLAACSGTAQNSALPSASAPLATQSNIAASCGGVSAGEVSCFALMRTDVGGGLKFDGNGPSAGKLLQSTTVSGYGPADLRSAYALPSTTAGSGQTIAIVDAYDDPTAENDMNVYRANFGIAACTTSSGCFRKLNQNGVQGSYPKTNGGWAQEISLDLDMASAVCPNCKIVLVEASSATNANLGTAVNTAVTAGANVVSNSYGGSETGATNAAYDHQGVIITASAGDNGTGPSQPCSYSTVVCVGGTNLQHASNTRGWAETAWSGSGSGCSAKVSKPSWQTDQGCTMRSESDISADADPNTGVAVYDSTAYRGASGWLVFGGTSVSSPVIASVYALAGNASSLGATYATSIWSDSSKSTNLNDVLSGSNGSCSIYYICNAGTGYDGPTGWGTPNGTGAF